ncbi:MAG: 3-hydroxyacyl-CoA dehydrogenase NAD-binding domain-containing protein [Paracoccaceae bacterium]
MDGMQRTPVMDALRGRELRIGPELRAIDGMKNWRLGHDDGVMWLALDCQDATVNTISEAELTELDGLLDRIEKERPKGVVILSAKTGGFAAGADIGQFRGMTEAGEVREKMARANRVTDRLAALPVPTLALIHGYCLGGGLEIALACDKRLAVGEVSLGFPEVRLGLIPGLGGVHRLTQLIDPVEAMTMMLTGKSAHTGKAKRLGLVDDAVPHRHARAAALALLEGEGGHERGLKARAMSSAPARMIAARQMRGRAEERAPKALYPAPHALIDLWEEHGDDPEALADAALHTFADLLTGEPAQNLIRVFFLREGLRARGEGDHGIGHVHVVGAGTMGGAIAAWAAREGFRVTLADLDTEALARAIGRATDLFDRKLYDSAARRDARDRLVADFRGNGVAHADLVIEAIAETAGAKTKLYAAIEPKMKAEAILATNTSAIPLADLRKGLKRPGQLLGLHFFNPVSAMELVEVVSDDKTDTSATHRAAAFVRAISRLPAPVRSAPGFLVNRILMPYLLEAVVMIDEGARPETIDAAAEAFGMAMGPAEVADRVGLDICEEVAGQLRKDLDSPLPDLPEWLQGKVRDGDLGAKSGNGIYKWDDDEPRKEEAGEVTDDMTDRLILPMVNMAAACLREGVVADADILDGAMVFAAGFAPVRGGPIHYARGRGMGEVKRRLAELGDRYGARFAPDPGLDALA